MKLTGSYAFPHKQAPDARRGGSQSCSPKPPWFPSDSPPTWKSSSAGSSRSSKANQTDRDGAEPPAQGHAAVGDQRKELQPRRRQRLDGAERADAREHVE